MSINLRSSMRNLLSGLLVASSLALLPASIQAQQVPPHIAKLVGQAKTTGQGTFRWFGIRIYQARLWTSRGQIRADEPVKAPIALTLTYARAFDGDRIAGRSIDEMQDLGFKDEAELARWKQRMSEVFPNVNSGDSLTGVFDASGMTRFFHNGKSVGNIRDPKFGLAFFSIWLDARTNAKKLRAQLLGLNRSVQDSRKPASNDDPQ